MGKEYPLSELHETDYEFDCITSEQYDRIRGETRKARSQLHAIIPEEIILKTHSDALYELVLRHSGEYDSLFKAALLEQGAQLDGNLTIGGTDV